MGMNPEKGIAGGFCQCVHHSVHFTNLDVVPPTTYLGYVVCLLLLGCRPMQHAAVLNTTGSCDYGRYLCVSA